jgi:hypothetical protein
MPCLACASRCTNLEFPAEALIHFPGLKNADKPGVFIFPKLSVCPNCGFARFSLPRFALEALRVGIQSDNSIARLTAPR